jgi:asparagine synthase (glutamine-hydrolysing)
LDEIILTYDEPYGDSSAIPTMLVSKLARKYVKMILSGDGGDELFFGYGSYKWAKRLSNPLLQKMRKPIASVLSQLGNREQRAAKLFQYDDYSKIKSHIFSQEQYFFSEKEIHQILTEEYYENIYLHENFSFSRKLTPPEQQAFFDLKYYLKDDLLVKIDRASMKYGLETRVPLLDYRIVEFALNLPTQLKIKNGISKFLLKETLYDYIPKKYFARPKWGFALPVGSWLKNELRYLLNEYLSEKIIRETGIVKYEAVKKLKEEFLCGKNFLYGRLWLMIVLHKFFHPPKVMP